MLAIPVVNISVREYGNKVPEPPLLIRILNGNYNTSNVQIYMQRNKVIIRK